MDLAQIRDEIDVLDQEMVEIIGRRQKWMQAARTQTEETDIPPPAERMDQIVRRVRVYARAAGADPDIVEATYRAMIGAFTELERRGYRSRGEALGARAVRGVMRGDRIRRHIP